MKRISHTALGWLHQTNPTAHYFYTMVLELERNQDSRADRVREMMTDAERDTVREAYKK